MNIFHLHFHNSPETFSIASAKVTFVISLLKGKALARVSPYLECNDPFLQNADKFLSSLQTVFDKSGRVLAAEFLLLDLQQQGTKTVAQYAATFRLLVAKTNWHAGALCAGFCKGLADRIKD